MDNEAVRTLALIGKAASPCAPITQLTIGQLGRSVIVKAEGGIYSKGGKVSKKKRITISGTHTCRVGTRDLVNYLAAPAPATRG